MDTSETLIIVTALFAAVALAGPRIEAIQKHADSRYPQLQAASTLHRIDCIGTMMDDVRMRACLARQAAQ